MGEICVQLVYVDEAGQLFDASLQLARGSTVEQAVLHSGLLSQYPNLALSTLNCGVYSRRKRLDEALLNHDRLEIYRPLLIDPKDRRRRVVDAKRNPKKWRQELSLRQQAYKKTV
jgi:putative ubiquitin-RnfH superfamily antitoxin RatB of RatAB toxin-antitoxin module